MSGTRITSVGRRPCPGEGSARELLGQRDGIPLYLKLASLFREKIRCGQWPKHSQLPTLLALRDEYGTARETVRQAGCRHGTLGQRRQRAGDVKGHTLYVRVAPDIAPRLFGETEVDQFDRPEFPRQLVKRHVGDHPGTEDHGPFPPLRHPGGAGDDGAGTFQMRLPRGATSAVARLGGDQFLEVAHTPVGLRARRRQIGESFQEHGRLISHLHPVETPGAATR